MSEVKDLIEEIGKDFEAFKEANEERQDAIKKGYEGRANELDARLEEINNNLTEAEKSKAGLERVNKYLQERVEKLEMLADDPRTAHIPASNRKHLDLFEKALRNRFEDANHNTELRTFEKTLYSEKAITIGTPAAGGYAVPEEIAAAIEKLEILVSPVRDLVGFRTVGTSDYKELISIGGATSGWVGESATRTETDTPQLREVVPTQGELYAYPQASEWSLDDMFFSVENWLTTEVGEEFAVQESQTVVDGDGVNKPTGMLNTAPQAVPDFPITRPAASYEYVANVDSALKIDADNLIDLVYKTNAIYRANARWAMNSLTTGEVRKIKDGDGNYLWRPGLAAGQPATILGYPVVTWEQMQDVANGAYPIAYGNFARGYRLVQRVGLRITVDNVTRPGFIKYYMRSRRGGIPLNNNAIKFLQTSTT